MNIITKRQKMTPPLQNIFLWFFIQEESASLSVTGKGGDQSKLDVHWTKEDIAQLDTSGLSVEKYSLKTRNTISRMNLKKINVDLIIVRM